MADQRTEAAPHTHTRDGPPMVDLMRYTLVGSTRVHRVLVEDLSIGIYQWVNRGKIFYLQTLNPFLDTLEGVKTIYIYLEETNSLVPKVVYKDKYNMEYKLVTPQEVSTYTFYGISLSISMLDQRTEEVEPRTQTSFPFKEEPASIGIPMPSSEARLGETQPM